jgi:hypothetical protein
MFHIRKLPAILLLAVLACSFQASHAQKQNPQFKVQVNLVSIDMEVLDRQGQPIDGLKQSDFLVEENGSAVQISNFARLSDAHVSLVVVLETSYMPQANLSIAKNTISLLIHLLKPKDEICLYTYNQKDAYLEQGFTRDRTKITRALDSIGVNSRSRRASRFGRSFAVPPQAGLGIDLGLAAAKKGTHPIKALLLIRDMVENLGAASLDHLQESGCAFIALGFAEREKRRLMLIQDQSGHEQLILGQGEKQSSEAEGNVAELCRTIARLLSSRYSITYHTPSPDLKGLRQIEVLIPGHSDYRIFARRSFTPSR